MPALACHTKLPDCHCSVVGLLALVLVICGPKHTGAQIPSESVIPGPIRLATDELPPESELPESYFHSPSDRPPGESVLKLPPESALPPTAVVQRLADDGAPDSILQLADSVDDRPWLRLVSPGSIGTVRSMTFSADSNRLFVAGDNKEVLTYQRNDVGTFVYERTVRWQVQRGERGRIYGLAAGPGLLAVGGYGAMGGLGEIVLCNPEQGSFLQPLVDNQSGHRQRIVSLAAVSKAERTELASMDHAGKLVLWQRDSQSGLWSHRTLAEDPLRSTQLEVWRMLHPICMTQAPEVIAPVFAGFNKDKECEWELRRYSTDTFQSQPLSDRVVRHRRMVTALAASASGSHVAAADEYGMLTIWTRGDSVNLTQQQLPGPITSLAISNDGRYLVAGLVAINGLEQPAQVQVWNLSDKPPRLAKELTTRAGTLACAISPDGHYVAYSEGSGIQVRRLTSEVQPVAQIVSPVQIPRSVAFAAGGPPYRIGISSQAGSTQDFPRVFDTESRQLMSATEAADLKWTRANAAQGTWSVRGESVENDVVYALYEGDARRGQLTLRMKSHGAVSATCWLMDAQGQARGVAVGTNGNNNIYVFGLQQDGFCPLLRQFRGHGGSVVSLSASSDQRYLTSASLDGTVGIWKLEDDATEDLLGNRWGLALATEEDSVVVRTIRADGPLYFRGLRAGDTIRRITVTKQQDGQFQSESIEAAADILRVLTNADQDAQIAFECVRGRTPLKAFQSFPAWHPVASLFFNDDREWAFWTPAGYYDASFAGHQLFGWQVNRGLNLAPDFFQAAQVRQILEKPELMSRLLRVGSIDDAFQQVRNMGPVNESSLLSQTHRLQPRIEVVKPAPGTTVTGESVDVEATVTLPVGERLVPPKAFANGVVAVQRKLVHESSENGQQVYRFQWQVPLPAESRVLIQVAAATEGEVAAMASVPIDQLARRPMRRRPRMYIVSAGINDYRDGRVPDLTFAVNNARVFTQSMKDHSRSLYETHAVSFADRAVTRSGWMATLQHFAQELRTDATPDDVLIIFMSGHGVRDPQSDQYYFVTADTEYASIRAQQYGACLSFEDFAQFGDVPCRKLVILDTCHSGAVQPTSQRELKSALRALQDDLVLTMTASEGTQEAVEEREKQFGRFTYRVLEAIRGAADQATFGNGDGTVDFPELANFVRHKVAEDSAVGSTQQHPTIGPPDLMAYVKLPLAGQNAIAMKTIGANRQRIASQLGNAPLPDIGVPSGPY